MNKEKQLEDLEISFQSGIITKEEYEEKKEEIKNRKEKETIKKEDMHIEKENREETKPKKNKSSSDKILIASALIILIIFAAVFIITKFSKEEPKTIEDLHTLNYQGKLKEEQGFLYKGIYSFINLDNTWYTQLESPEGTKILNVGFRYSPKELEDFPAAGYLNITKFNSEKDYYVTFNPKGNYDSSGEGSFSHVVLAINDLNQHMISVFEKTPIAACDRNETKACSEKPIIDCSNTKKIVFYIKDSEQNNIKYEDNCIIIEGKGLDLVKAVDKALYQFYDIMDKS